MFCFKKIIDKSRILYERHAKDKYGNCLPQIYGENSINDFNLNANGVIINTSNIYTASFFNNGTAEISIFDENKKELFFQILDHLEANKLLIFINSHLCGN